MADEPSRKRFARPRGTRDFYPAEMLRRRWIEQKWREVSIRHGFEEIDGPRFEHLDLYTQKSGEEIVSQLFSFQRRLPPSGRGVGGEGSDQSDDRPWFALRPEFTPTLARMYAERAESLPKPTRWFSIGPYFRAERPQRGRLREFLQWNADIIGDDSPEADAELIRLTIDFLKDLNFDPSMVTVLFSDRKLVSEILTQQGVPPEKHETAFQFLDRAAKLDEQTVREEANRLDLPVDLTARLAGAFSAEPLAEMRERVGGEYAEWLKPELGVVRGLAYYTGTVFEVHETGGKERAIAGGGRYDNLIETMGGPPTPAVGFAMGDVVLANVLQDKGLMPSDEQLAEELGARPDVFVISTGDEQSEELLRPTVAQLRRAGLHARHTDRSTRNVGKLLKEADNCHARFAAILGADETASLKDLDSGRQEDDIPLSDLTERIKRQRDRR